MDIINFLNNAINFYQKKNLNLNLEALCLI